MPVVRIPTVLRKHTEGQAKVQVPGATVGQAFDRLVSDHPGLREQLFEDGSLRGFVNVYVDDEDIRFVSGLDTPIEDDGEIAIMPAVAGGAERSEHARRVSAAGGAERSEHARRVSAAAGTSV